MSDRVGYSVHCPGTVPTEMAPPILSYGSGLQPAGSVEVDTPVGISSAWAKMGAVLVAHEGLQLLLLGDISTTFTARAASLGQAWREGKTRTGVRGQVKKSLGLFSIQLSRRQVGQSGILDTGRGC